jgi:hypothetical protein
VCGTREEGETKSQKRNIYGMTKSGKESKADAAKKKKGEYFFQYCEANL